MAEAGWFAVVGALIVGAIALAKKLGFLFEEKDDAPSGPVKEPFRELDETEERIREARRLGTEAEIESTQPAELGEDLEKFWDDY